MSNSKLSKFEGEKLRIGILGLSHDHVWDNLPEMRDIPGVELVAAADSDQELLDRVRREYRVETHEDWEDLLNEGAVDAVMVYGNNAESVMMAGEALGLGMHVLLEKPMANRLNGADFLLAQSRTCDARLMVNWPFAWWPQLREALRLAKEGAIGQIWQVRYRAAHAGPREMGCSEAFYSWLYDPSLNGGGAYADYCGYGALLACHVLGIPGHVQAFAGRYCKQDILTEDNGMLVMQYPRALAVSEGSWTQVGYLDCYQTYIHGSQGSLLVEPRKGGRLLQADALNPQGKVLEVPEPASGMENASCHFVHCLRTGEPFAPLCQDQLCRDTQEILEAGWLSLDQGKPVNLPLPWTRS